MAGPRRSLRRTSQRLSAARNDKEQTSGSTSTSNSSSSPSSGSAVSSNLPSDSYADAKPTSNRSRRSLNTTKSKSPRNLRRTQAQAQRAQEASDSDESDSEYDESVDASKEPTVELDEPPSSSVEPTPEMTPSSDIESETSEPPISAKSRKREKNTKLTRSDKSHARSRQSDLDPRAEFYFMGQTEIQQWRRQEAVKRFKYLLDLSDVFRHFVDLRAQRDSEFRSILDEAEEANRSQTRAMRRGKRASMGQRKSGTRRRGRRGRGASSAQEDEEEELLEEPEEDEGPITVFTETPAFLKGKLRQYQIDGLNWLISLFQNSISGILADEMGLGKTFQCISFLSYLWHVRSICGPHLVIVPKSTVQNWAREFEKWAPDLEVLVLSGDKQERADLIKDRVLKCKFDVCITSFEIVIREKSALQRFAWQYIVVDEAHRIKNEESILSKIMRALFSRHRLLITGTPLQNNLHELWALLNFLLPDVFADSEVFDEWFKTGNSAKSGQTNEDAEARSDEAEDKDNERDQDRVIEQLHRLLRPFLLRRVKADVEKSLLPKREINLYVGMTDMQIKWYQRLLEKDLDAVNGGGPGESKMRLLNVVMQLRKCCNHPYLFDGAEPGPPFTTDEHLVQNSGKMVLLSKLLTRLKDQGSRVLIFSQMGRMLDILEDYCSLRGYEYCRIDGSTVHEDRVDAIDEFNKPGSSKFLFLLTTRAGGLGINLTTADQVILYDSDWNPQADLQAMDRAHRIGQTKQVTVYRFVTQNAIEEKVLERAAHKLRLDQLVIQQNRNSAQEKAKAAASKEELVNMIRHGAQSVFDQSKGTLNVEESIDDIIQQGEAKTRQLNAKYLGLGLDELQNFTFDAPPTQKIVNHNKPKDADELDEFHHHHRRARAAAIVYGDAAYTGGEGEDDGSSDEDHDETGSVNGSSGTTGGGKRGGLRIPRQLPLHDFQFFDPELEELQDRELAWYRKQAGIRLAPEDFSEDEEDESGAMNEEIENATPLTPEEQDRKEELIRQGFQYFTKRDFHHYLSLVTRFGRNGIESIVERWPEKDPDEIRRYHEVFCARYTELPDHERYMAQLEAGETRARQQTQEHELLRQKVESFRAPMAELTVNYPAFTSRKSYSEDEDRFLVTQMVELGLDAPNLPDKIRDRIRSSGLFDFDWFFLSRTPVELSRRCHTLKLIICREMIGTGENTNGSSRKRKGKSIVKTNGDGEEDFKRARGERADSSALSSD